jgi:hypothetical protein
MGFAVDNRECWSLSYSLGLVGGAGWFTGETSFTYERDVHFPSDPHRNPENT